MSNKIEIDEIIAVMKDKQIPDPKIQEVLKELNQILKDNKEDKEDSAQPKSKNKYIVVLRSDNKEIAKELTQGAFIFQTKENDDSSNLFQRIQTAARAHNDSLKRAKSRIVSLGDMARFIKRKFTKDGGFHIKTKLPVEIITISQDDITK